MDRNGRISHYTVYYTGSRLQPEQKQLTAAHSESEHLIEGLEEASEYSVSISASTLEGEGPISTEMKVTTLTSSKYLSLHLASVIDRIYRYSVLSVPVSMFMSGFNHHCVVYSSLCRCIQLERHSCGHWLHPSGVGRAALPRQERRAHWLRSYVLEEYRRF